MDLSSDALASVLNTVISGIPSTQVRDDIYLVDVIARATDEAAGVARDVAPIAGSASQRPHGSAQPIRDLRI